MKKIINLLLIASVFILFGCATAKKDDRPALSFENFETALTESNLNFEEVEKEPAFISAIEGKGYEINGDIVEMYKYNSDSKALKTATKDKRIEVGAFGTFPVEVNGNYILMLSDHPDSESITKIFTSFDGSK